MSEIKINKEQLDNKISYLTFMQEQLPAYATNYLSKGDNVLQSVDMIVNLMSDIEAIMRIYKWLLADDLESLRSAGNAWINADVYVDKYYS